MSPAAARPLSWIVCCPARSTRCQSPPSGWVKSIAVAVRLNFAPWVSPEQAGTFALIKHLHLFLACLLYYRFAQEHITAGLSAGYLWQWTEWLGQWQHLWRRCHLHGHQYVDAQHYQGVANGELESHIQSDLNLEVI